MSLEIIDLGELDSGLGSSTIQLDLDDISPGLGGAEFLMNEKSRSNSSGNIQLDIGDIESELNNLSTGPSKSTPAPAPSNYGTNTGMGDKILGGLSSFFGSGPSAPSDPNTKTVNTGPNQSSIGNATKEASQSSGSSRTWDGFMKFGGNGVSNVDKVIPPKMTEREKIRKKKIMLKRLDDWRKKDQEKGIHSYSNLNENSSYEEIEDEYETAMEEKNKKNAVKLYQWWFMTAVNTLEYGNAAINPFDLNLDGWGEQINEDIDSYDEIFGELYEKYKGGKMAPELALVMRLGFSAVMVNFTNKALSSVTPGFNDVIRQSPELMKEFSRATAASMSQQNPGFAFMNDMLKPDAMPKTGNMGPPPTQHVIREERPDLMSARNSGMFQEKGVELGGYGSANTQEKSYRPGYEPTFQSMNQGPMPASASAPAPAYRPEMKGPGTDVDFILSGLKTKTVDMKRDDNTSMISATSLRDLGESSMPKRGKRRNNNGSEKNVVSLDL